MLHFVGVMLVIAFPHMTCVIGFLVALVWKRNYKIARNIICYILLWSITSIHGVGYGIMSIFTLFIISPRFFHEVFNNTLTVVCTWILNTIFPFLYSKPSSDGDKFKLSNVYSGDFPTVSIIVCNKDETKKVFDESVRSITQSKSYAENMLNFNHIRLVLADGGSKNIDYIKENFGCMFDSIEVIPGGKLTGRHNCSLKEASDIIVAYDSDRKYDHRNTFELLLPFIKDYRNLATVENQKEELVVGTTHYVNTDGIFPFNGGNSAYLRRAYLKHPFNTKINQTTTSSIWKEEEIDWGNNLIKCGKVVSVKALYSDINPLPFVSLIKRMLNCKDSFMGGVDRCKGKEDDFVIIYKITLITLFSIFIPLKFY